jgi:DNA helicase-2/ATP-dependent DNA helicase PcrA
MIKFTPTAEQLAITEAASASTTNMAVVARAGAAKTSTLIMIAEALPTTDILCLAFNKKIAEEMTERLPANCEAKTLHGLGFAAWRGFIPARINVSPRKVYQLLRLAIDQLPPEDKEEAFGCMAETLDFINKGKQVGYLPDACKGHWRALMGDDDFFLTLPMEPTPLQVALVQDVSAQSFKDALRGEIDFDDMIMCPALCQVSWPTPSLTLIDEAQDLSSINHHILKKIVKKRRIIAVGDPLQAIYGFRGAYSDSIERLIDLFGMDEYRLTISFRCSLSVTQNVKWIAPDMRSPEWAAVGAVKRPLEWEVADIHEGDAVICRNNAPLFRMALLLIEHDKLPEISGRDLAAPLTKLMDKLGKPPMPRLAALDSLADWEEKEVKRARKGAIGGIRDKAECVRIMLEKTATLGEAAKYLKHLLARDGRIKLMTGHKSKGLEFDNVFFLNSDLCRIDRDQDANVKYVIETRAKDTLTYINMEKES